HPQTYLRHIHLFHSPFLLTLLTTPLTLGCPPGGMSMTEDSSSTGEEDDSILGESASVKCTQAMDQLVIFQSALATALQSSPLDVSSARTAYVTTPLQYYIQDLDALHERNDDQMI